MSFQKVILYKYFTYEKIAEIINKNQVIFELS